MVYKTKVPPPPLNRGERETEREREREREREIFLGKEQIHHLPAFNPLASTRVLAVSSNSSHISISLTPGRIQRCMNFRVCLQVEG